MVEGSWFQLKEEFVDGVNQIDSKLMYKHCVLQRLLFCKHYFSDLCEGTAEQGLVALRSPLPLPLPPSFVTWPDNIFFLWNETRYLCWLLVQQHPKQSKWKENLTEKNSKLKYNCYLVLWIYKICQHFNFIQESSYLLAKWQTRTHY